MNTNTDLLPESTDLTKWGQALYAFLAEKHRGSGSMRTVQSYSRILNHFFGRLGKTPDQVGSAEVMVDATSFAFVVINFSSNGRSFLAEHTADLIRESVPTPNTADNYADFVRVSTSGGTALSPGELGNLKSSSAPYDGPAALMHPSTTLWKSLGIRSDY